MIPDQRTVRELLDMTGVRFRGPKRADCPECKRFRTLSFSVEVFHCHGCGWSGNAVTLSRELGYDIPRETPEAVLRRRERQREAARFTEWLRNRRLHAATLLRALGTAELNWCEAGRDQILRGQMVNEHTWTKIEQIAAWHESAEARYGQLCDVEANGAELLAEFRGKAAA